MEEKLEKLHAQISELIKFAETKNAGLVLANGAVSLEMLKLLFGEKTPGYLSWIFTYILLLNAISLFLCLFSLLPNRQETVLPLSEELPLPTENILFFGVIRRFGIENYYEEFKSRYSLKVKSEEYCKNLIEQMIIQSQILTRKFDIFGLSAILTISSFVSPVALLIWWHAKKDVK